MITAVAAVGPVLGALHLSRRDRLVANAEVRRDPARILQFPLRQRGRLAGHGEDVRRTERLRGEIEEHGAVDTSGKRDEHPATFAQTSACDLPLVRG